MENIMSQNTITIIDNYMSGFSAGNTYKVIVTDHQDNSVSLTGLKATDYIKSTYLSGYINNNDLPVDSGILPPGVRMLGQNYVVFERPPTYQNVFYNVNRVEEQNPDEDNENSPNIFLYRIPMPWQVYIATFTKDYYINDVYMFFSNTSLFTADQELYLAPIPNFYTNGLLCRPVFAHMEDIERYPKNLSGVVAGAYDWVWNNGTNNDLNEAMVHVNLQIAKDVNQRSNTIFSKMSEEDYSVYFRNPYNMHYYNSARVQLILSAWEKCTLEEVINYKWPAFSSEKHFDQSQYSPSVPHDITEHSNYYDWLEQWAYEYYGEEYSEEQIDSLINNDDYNHDSYYEYVLENHIQVDLVDPQFNQMTLSNAINRIETSNNGYNIKNIFNSYIQKAFEISGSNVQSA